jgi:hypothetical protein
MTFGGWYAARVRGPSPSPSRSHRGGAEVNRKRFVAKAKEAVAVIEMLSDADWKEMTAAEHWPVNVTVHHQNFLPECRSRRSSFDIIWRDTHEIPVADIR